MVSFLIPTYNYDITELLLNIIECCKHSACDYEVLAYDDASPKKRYHRVNDFLNGLDNVTYKVLDTNIGRSAIRNLLANDAKGEYLCFIDCDCIPKQKDFLDKYLLNIQNSDVVCGGTKYKNIEEIEPKYYLHHKNGTKREEGQQHFTTDNFFIRKDVFFDVCFDENIKGYGHEDTVFGLELRHKGFKIKNIDNPVYHFGLKDTEKFLYDTYNSQRNLRQLYDNPQYAPLISDCAVIKAYNKLNKYHMTHIYHAIITLLTPLIKRQLHTTRPYLHLLDLYKLNIFINP